MYILDKNFADMSLSIIELEDYIFAIGATKHSAYHMIEEAKSNARKFYIYRRKEL